ncbi:MAG: hypothetical protein K2N23_07940 [Clostridia bacterium]|nr:hypothetical protein [Clostridia bacterium]
MAFTVTNLEGNEIAEGEYVRTASEGGRWGDTWSVFKSNFGKIVLNNLFVLLFFLPAVAVFFVRTLYVGGLGFQYPFNANTGIGYPAYPGTQGLTESIYLSADLLFYGLLIVAGLIASIGIAGGAYSMKKLLNTHGKFSIKSFFHGVKVGYLNVAAPVTVFLCFYYACVLIGDWKNLNAARGLSTAGAITAYVFIIIATVLVGIYCAWMLATGVSYKLKVGQLFKNSFIFMIGSPIQTIFFAGLTLMPVWLFMIGLSVTFIKYLAYVVFIIFGFSYMLLVWMSFTQWVYDLYVTPNLKKSEEAVKAKKTPQELAAEQESEAKRIAGELLAAGKSELIAKPILPIDNNAEVKTLSVTFTRNDLNVVSENRKKLNADILAYEEEHKNDAGYKEYNALFVDREKALKTDNKKSKKKKISADNLLR